MKNYKSHDNIEKMHRVFSLFKSRFFRIIFMVFFVIGGILAFQKFQDLQNPACKDCNLILISIDALRADHMGAYGYPKDTTPQIDKFAKNSILYKNTYAEVPMTYPSFVSLMTGKDAVETGIYSNRVITNPDGTTVSITSENIDPQTKTLSEILKQHNYYNVAYIANPELGPDIVNMNREFDIYRIINKTNFKGYEKEMVDTPINLLTKNKKKLFLWLHFIDPHSPYTPPANFGCKFGNNCQAIHDLGPEEIDNQRKLTQDCQVNPPDSKQVNIYTTLYDGEIGYTDSLIGKVLEAIKKNNLLKNSIVIIYSDHGEGFDHHYYYNHPGIVFNSTTHIPLIIYTPGNKTGISNQLIQNNDIFSMILTNLGISTPKQTRKFAFGSNITRKEFSITDGRYKYILFLKGSCMHQTDGESLYDLITDPKETTDILSRKSSLAQIFKKELIQHFSLQQPENLNEPQRTDVGNYNKNTIDQIKSLGY